ncbi:YhgE/Pip family protein [Arthrobacter sp. GMC3]|uniref:YhgE/Pip family protein n=1 Tax=Arthrobacter sp. GMC3 TaxID=2058894 RepID=UPI000CE51D12|nr:YhgE/Pip domain-containing protein [Arthrobacter sp. GMC3]
MFAFLSSGTELSRFKRGKMPKIAVAVMLFIPLIYGALYLWAFQAPDKHMNDLPVALVNEDTGATNGTEPIHAGTDLANELMGGMELKWDKVDATDAAQGVADGKYYFALTIPANFSTNAVSVGTDTPAQTMLDVQYNDSNNFLSTVLGKQAMAQVRDAVAQQLGEQTSSTLLVGLHDAGTGLRAAADGSAEITTGLDSAKDGAGKLVIGMNDLASGSLTLQNGAGQLATGATTLSQGINTLAGGTSSLFNGASSLSTGANSLASGVGTLSDGAGQLATASKTLSDGTGTLAAKMNDSLPDAQKLGTGATSVSDNAALLAASAAKVSGSVAMLGTNADGVSAGAAAAAENLNALISRAQNGEAISAQQLQVLQSQLTPVAGGSAALAAGVHQLGTDGATPLAAGADSLSKGAAVVSGGVGKLTTGVTEAATGASTLSAGANRLHDAAIKLAAGAANAATGSHDVAAGASSLTDGASQLAAGASSANDGAAALAAGAGTLSDGTSDLVTGTGKLVDGGATLSEGADKLATGSHTLTQKLRDGGQALPNDSLALLDHKAQVLANPVGVNASWDNQSSSFGVGFAPFFIALATFVGALISWLLLRALPTRALAAGASGIRAVLTGLLPALAIGLGQVLIMVAVLLWGLKMDPVYPVAMAGFIYLTTVAFLALQQMFIIVLGTAAGRVLSLVLLMLQLSSSGGTYPVETTPGFFQALHPFMPATYVVNGLRELTTGGIDSRMWIAVAFLVAMTVGSVAISSWSAGRQRVFSIKRLHPELEM